MLIEILKPVFDFRNKNRFYNLYIW